MIQNAKQRVLQLEKEVLLGLSGGPDSMCLFALLLECKRPFQIAHVDHNQSGQSALEKERLENLATAHSIPFHSITLDAKNLPKQNLEEVFRDKRIAFFKRVMKNEGIGLLMLGHQKDELAETVIKRFFEGGALEKLSGIKESSAYRGMHILRPLLNTSKKEVITYLKAKDIFYYQDPTNIGEHNLRARMRANLIPMLEESFGKNIVSSVCDTSDQAHELEEFLQREFCKLDKLIIPGRFGLFFPYREGVDSFLYTRFILKHLRDHGLLFSREMRAFIGASVKKKTSGKSLIFPTHILFFEKDGVFLIQKDLYNPELFLSCQKFNWLDMWKEKPPVSQTLTKAEYAELQVGLNDYHRRNKTPICLRRIFPIIVRGDHDEISFMSLTAIEKKIKMLSS